MALSQRPFGPSPQAVSGQNVYSQNVQAALAQGVLPAKQSITVTTEVVLVNPLNTAQLLAVPLPPNIGLEQIPFDIVISGYVKTTAAGNVTIKLYSGTSATVGSDTALASTGAVAVTTTSCPFWLQVKGTYDSVSGKFQGQYNGNINNTVVAGTAITAVPTGISDANDPVMTFLASITSSGAGVATPTTINVQNFSAG